MAFIAEDGTGLANANSYATLQFADDYHADRGNGSWGLETPANRQAALVRATDYADKRFGARFRGFRESQQQALEWPRFSAFDNDDFLLRNIPSQLLKAVAEYALRALTTNPLVPDNTQVGLTLNRSKVGPIEIEKKTNTVGGKSSLVDPTSIPDYPEGDLWMNELINSNLTARVIRG